MGFFCHFPHWVCSADIYFPVAAIARAKGPGSLKKFLAAEPGRNRVHTVRVCRGLTQGSRRCRAALIDGHLLKANPGFLSVLCQQQPPMACPKFPLFAAQPFALQRIIGGRSKGNTRCLSQRALFYVWRSSPSVGSPLLDYTRNQRGRNVPRCIQSTEAILVELTITFRWLL